MAKIPNISVNYFVNPDCDPALPYSKAASHILNADNFKYAQAEITTWPNYQVTPLLQLQSLANKLGVTQIAYKDESSRFGLGSFKSLGGAYAVGQLLCREVGKRMGRTINFDELRTHEDVRQICATLTVATATDGNHGRSVAWGAHLFGCQCVIYIHATVSSGRENAIARYGARVVRTQGHYDQAVQQVDKDAKENGWFLISDTSYPGYTDIPRDVMQGYQLMVAEAVQQLKKPPTHVFVQSGVGGLPAAVCAYFWEHYGLERPIFIVAEPKAADCLYQSALAGEIKPASGDLNTIMAGLACGEVSTLAWDILKHGSNAFCTIDEDAAIATMKLLAYPRGNDPAIVAGESAVAGLAAAIGLLQSAKARIALGLDENSRLLLFGTEGDTDPVLYQQLVGATAEQVLAGIKLR